MRVGSGRFMRSLIRPLTGYAQKAHKTGILSLRRTRLARSGFVVESRAARCSVLLRMFGPSCSATLVKYRNTTMAAADFYTVTPRVSTRRAVTPMMIAANSSHAAGS